MTSTDLKTGDFVQHPEKGHGLVRRRFAGNDVGVVYADQDRDGIDSFDLDLTGWERVETCTAGERRILDDFREVASGEAQEAVYPEAGVVIAPHADFEQRPELVKPGHVQVRVDDLELGGWLNKPDDDNIWGESARVAIRAANAIAAQRAESTPPADEPEIVGDGCECWVTPEHTWTTYGSAVEPGSQVEYNPRCPKHGEKPTSATVTLFCPDCGGAENVTVVMLGKQSNGERWFDLREFHAHTCPPAQPDEPTEPGVRVSVCDMRLVSIVQSLTGKRLFADVKSGHVYFWDDLTERGTVTIGWDE